MRRIITLVFPFVLFLLFAFLGNDAKASHIMGADISYSCIPGTNNQYLVTFKFYRDCTGIPTPGTFTLNVNSPSGCGGAPFTVTLNPVAGETSIDVTPLCPSLRHCNVCNPNAQLKPQGDCDFIYQGVEYTKFEGIVTLPANCTDWSLSITHGARNAAVTNLASGANIFIEANLNNTITPCNNSVVFTELPVPYICENQLYNYNHGAFDADGDSIVYTFIQPLGTGGNPINYTGSLSITNPLNLIGNFGFNNQNGQLTFTPDGQQVAVMAVKACEYRNQVLIGCVIRDIQVVVIQCASNQVAPSPSPIFNMNSIGYLIDSTTIGVCPGNQLRWSITGVDGNQLDSVYLSTNISTVLPGATYTVQGNNPTTINFRWTPTAADTGLHTYTLTLKDNHCPIYSSQTFGYSILVNKEVKASPDTITCTAAGPIILTARGGNEFKWRPNKYIIDASGPDSSWIKINPLTSTQYVVKSTDCNNEDTVNVTVVPSFSFNTNPAYDTTICKYQTVPLQVKPDLTFGPYTYKWSPADSLSSTTNATIFAKPIVDKKYYVSIRSQAGCTLKDSFQIYIKGEAPIVNVFASKNAMCPDPTDQVQLELVTTPGSCGINTSTCQTTPKEFLVGKGAKLSTTNHPFRANSEKGRTQMLFTPTELNNLGFIGGTINKIAFNVSKKNSTGPYKEFTIRMGCANNGFQNKFIDELVEVYAPRDFTTKAGWNEIVLDNGYDWNGSTNLVIEICYTNSYKSQDDELFTTTTPYQSILSKVDDTPNIFGCELFTALSAKTERPNMKFSVCIDQPSHYVIDWTPGYALSDSTIGQPVIKSPDFDKTTTYTVNVDNVGCANSKDITIIKDTSEIFVSKDTILCNPSTVQLNSSLLPANPPVMKLSCGVNGTTSPYPAIEYQPASGNTNHQGTIFRGTMEDVRYQILYLSDQLKAAGLKPGIISEYAFEIATKASSIPVENFTIRMGCTDAINLSTSAWEATDSTPVYSVASYSSKLGWNTFVLDNAFDWDGESNILIEICWDNPAGAGLDGDDQIMTEVVSYKAISRAYTSGASGCSIPSPTSVDERLPNARFKIADPPLGQLQPMWSPGLTLNDSTIYDPIASPTETTSYIMSIESEYGCIYKDTTTIYIGFLDASIDPDTVICLGDSVMLQAYDAYTYTWSPSSTLSTDTGQSVLAYPYQTTTYTVTVTDTIGCKEEMYVTVDINQLPIVEAGDSDSIFLGQSITLNGSGGVSYLWDPPLYLDDPTLPNPVATPAEKITYYMTATDINGCKNNDSVTIYLYSNDDLLIPTAFSPNGDGINELFTISQVGVSEIVSVEIYNRWGKLIHKSSGSYTGWDGKFEGVDQPMGTYIYRIIGRKYDGTDIVYTGNLTLLR